MLVEDEPEEALTTMMIIWGKVFMPRWAPVDVLLLPNLHNVCVLRFIIHPLMCLLSNRFGKLELATIPTCDVFLLLRSRCRRLNWGSAEWNVSPLWL